MDEPTNNTVLADAPAPSSKDVADLLQSVLAAQASLKARNDELALQVATLEARVAALEAPGEFYVVATVDAFGSRHKVEVMLRAIFEAERAQDKTVVLLHGPLDYKAACVAYHDERRRAISASAGRA